MRIIEDIPYVNSPSPQQTLDLLLPDGEAFPIFIYFHGGGLENGSKKKRPFADDLLAKGIAVASADYRMYPAARFPDFIEDAACAVAWVKEHISEYGNCTGIYVGGSSAGGYLTQMLCFDKRYLEKHGIDADCLSGYLMDAGQPTSHFNVLRERGIDTRRVIVDETAPLYFVDGERDYPPIKIVVSDQDMPNRLEQTTLLVSTLKHFEHDMSKVDYELVENSKHCQYIKEVKDGVNVFAKMVSSFIKKQEVRHG